MKIFNRNSKTIISGLLIFFIILLVPLIAYASGIRLEDVLVGAVLIATGAYFVYAGATAAATTGLTWGVGSAAGASGTMIVGGGYLVVQGHKFWTGENKLDYGNRSTNNEDNIPDDANCLYLSVEPDTLPMDGASQATITIQLKNGYGDVLDSLPEGLSLWVRHTNEYAYLVEGSYSYSSFNAQGSSGTDSLINISDFNSSLAIPGYISTIGYSLAEECQAVLLEILNSAGNVVYSLAESVPNPARPIPFVWKGIAMDGTNLTEGSYTVRLKALGENNTVKGSTIRTMYIGGPIEALEDREITYMSGAAYLTLTAPLIEDITSDTITIMLKVDSGIIAQSASKTIDFTKDGESPQESISINSLPHNITKYIDGNLITLSFNEDGTTSTLTDSSTGNRYHFTDGNSDFTIEKSDGTIEMPLVHWNVTDPNIVEVSEGGYEDAAEKVNSLLEQMASSKGITFNSNTGLPIIANLDDGTSFAVEETGDGILSVSVNIPEDQTYEFAADFDNWTFSTLFGDVVVADTINLDQISTAAVPSGITAMAVSASKKAEITEKIRVAASVYKGKKKYSEVKKVASIEPSETSSFVWPVELSFPEDLSSNFGPRQVGAKKHFHQALDLAVATTVKSATDGIIYSAGSDPTGYGYNVRIKSKINGKNYIIIYAHLANNSVFQEIKGKAKNGNSISAGESIGTSSDSGYATGIHLHFEVKEFKETGYASRTNPLKFINYTNAAPIIETVEGPLDGNGDSIEVGENISNPSQFRVLIKSEEKDLNKVRFWLTKSGITIFDRTFNYHDDAILGYSYWRSNRYTTDYFSWNSSGSMLMKPIDNNAPKSDEFVCVWNSHLVDGDYTLRVEAWNIKDSKAETKEITFSVSGGQRLN